MDLLARITLKLIAVGALDSGLVLVAQLTPDIIGINTGTGISSRHHHGSEVIGGEILNSLLRNLERTMALWTLDFPAGG